MQRSLMADLCFHQSLLEVSEDRGRLQLYCHEYGKWCSASITVPGRGEESQRRHMMLCQPAGEVQVGARKPCTRSCDTSTLCPAPHCQSLDEGAGLILSTSAEEPPGHLWPPTALRCCHHAQHISCSVSKLRPIRLLHSELNPQE